MPYYLQLSAPGTVVGFQSSPAEITNEDAGNASILNIPDNNPTVIGYRYLDTVVAGVTVLGADYLSQFEAPPAPGCFWDGAEWVCPPAPGYYWDGAEWVGPPAE